MVEYVNKKYKSGLLSLFCLFYREELQALLIGRHELQARASRGDLTHSIYCGSYFYRDELQARASKRLLYLSIYFRT